MEKRMQVRSIIVRCEDCGAGIEMATSTFDLAMEVGEGQFFCDDCGDTDEDKTRQGGDARE